MNPCDFRLWGYLKVMMYGDPITYLFDFIESIQRHVRNIAQFSLLSTVEHAVLIRMGADNGGHHTKHDL
ncbi:hypothetical protein TNCV_4408651 [Trichonephila clavipes]|nr:hypothetical protein TNCV_4408651 [Trichonephila clavipes]